MEKGINCWYMEWHGGNSETIQSEGYYTLMRLWIFLCSRAEIKVVAVSEMQWREKAGNDQPRGLWDDEHFMCVYWMVVMWMNTFATINRTIHLKTTYVFSINYTWVKTITKIFIFNFIYHLYWATRYQVIGLNINLGYICELL